MWEGVGGHAGVFVCMEKKEKEKKEKKRTEGDFPFHFRDWGKTGSGQSWIGGNYTEWEVASLECSGREISCFFQEKNWYPKNETENADLYRQFY